jgi:hypothetical protein
VCVCVCCVVWWVTCFGVVAGEAERLDTLGVGVVVLTHI